MRQPFYSPLAKSDLREIAVYLAARNKAAASRIVREIRLRCRTLAKRPGLGAMHPDLDLEVRASTVWPYVVLYREVVVGIRVERVLHSARDIDSIFRGAKPEETDEEE